MKIIKNEVLSALLELQNRIAKLIIAYKQVSSSTNLVRQTDCHAPNYTIHCKKNYFSKFHHDVLFTCRFLLIVLFFFFSAFQQILLCFLALHC